jgi:hypothetical protein
MCRNIIVWVLLDLDFSIPPPSYYFHDLAATNDSKMTHVFMNRCLEPEETPYLDRDIFKGLLLGRQQVAKSGRSVAVDILVIIVVIRLPQHKTDLLLSMNYPMTSSASSSNELNEDFRMILSTFRIQDTSIFDRIR